MIIRELVIGIFLMVGIVLGFNLFYLDVATQTLDPTIPNIVTTKSMESTGHYRALLYNSTALIDTDSNQYLNTLKNIPVLGFLAAITVQGASVVNLFFQIPNLFLIPFNDIVVGLGLPSESIIIIESIIAAIVIFIVVSAFIRWRV